jgi:hypothetical protein
MKKQGKRRGVRWFITVALAVAAAGAPARALAELRVQNHRFPSICRLVVFVENARGSKVIYDGSLNRRGYRTFNSVGSTLCIQRSVVAERCNSGLTRPVCKVDRHSNRTVLWTIQ